MLEKIQFKAPKIPELVMNSILGAIEKGTIKINEDLPAERELAAALGVGRGSLRECLAILEFLGIIEGRGNRKVVVKQPDYIKKAIIFVRLSDNYDTLTDFIEFRIAIEVAIVELACERATSEDIANLEETTLRFMNEPGDLTADVEFHQILAKASHNSLFAIIIDLVNSLIMNLRVSFWALPTYHQITLESHRNILDAVKKRDKELAKLVMLQHFEHIREFAKQQDKISAEQ